MNDRDREHPEVRLGRAREYYAHAVRVGDRAAKQEAEEEIAAAKRAIAAEEGLPEDVRAALERDIEALRGRIGSRDGAASLERVRKLAAYGEVEIHDMAAAALDGDEAAYAIARVSFGRRAVMERSRVMLEDLGEEFARELGEVDGALARARIDMEAAMGRGTAARAGQLSVDPEDRWSGIAGRALGALTLAAALAQFELARISLGTVLGLVPAATIAIGYVITLGVVAALTGRSIAFDEARASGVIWTRWTIQIAVLSVAPILLAALAVAESPNLDLIAGMVLATLGLLFGALSLALGYQGVVRQRRRAARFDEIAHDEVRVRELFASLCAERLSLLRAYVARGTTLIADARHLDALFVHQALQRAPYLSDSLVDALGDLPFPRWLRAAQDELDAARQAQSVQGAPVVAA